MRDDKTPLVPPDDAKEIPGFPGYFVTPDGDVWSIRSGAAYLLCQDVEKKMGYRRVTLYLGKGGGKPRKKFVHALVLESFVGPCPDGLECRHLDGNPANNRVGNLAWGTKSENSKDRFRHGYTTAGEENSQAKLTYRQVVGMRLLWRWDDTQADIARVFGVDFRTVNQIIRRKSWKAVTRAVL